MGVSGDQTLSLRDYVSLDPLPGSDAVGSGSDDAAEVFGMEVKEGSVVLYLFGIAVMLWPLKRKVQGQKLSEGFIFKGLGDLQRKRKRARLL